MSTLCSRGDGLYTFLTEISQFSALFDYLIIDTHYHCSFSGEFKSTKTVLV